MSLVHHQLVWVNNMTRSICQHQSMAVLFVRQFFLEFLSNLHTVDARASMCPGLLDFYCHELLRICEDTMI
jgi:hypothetical protein